jgi:hypothetical protein
MAKIVKTGPWTKKDKDFIAENHNKLTPKEIASVLGRNDDTVKKYIEEHYSSLFQHKAKSAEYDIQNSPIWDDIQSQFSKEELKKFLYHWGRIVSQFRDDVYPTEEIQVIDTIKIEILMNRCLNHQKRNLQEIEELEADLEREQNTGSPDPQVVFELQKQIGVLRASQESLNSNYRSMLDNKNKILKEMKATRDARIKVLENSKQSFPTWMRRLLEDKDMRLKLGYDMEKMRLAANKEYERLSELHTYVNGEVDQPFLTPENVVD